MSETLEAELLGQEKTLAQPQQKVESPRDIINQCLEAMGEVLPRQVDNMQVLIKDNVAFALRDSNDLYFRISEDDYQIIGDKYKIIRMNDRRYIFERVTPDIKSSADGLLQLFTKSIWEISGKANTRY